MTSPHATIGGAIPIQRVANLDASIAYYIAQLGFELQWRDRAVASVTRDRASLILCEGDQGEPLGDWLDGDERRWVAVLGGGWLAAE